MRKLLLIIVLAGLLCTSDISEAHGNPASPGRVIPVAGKVLRRFQMGESDWSPGHRGVDLAGIEGQQVVSPESGVVSWVGRINGVPMMSIQHPDGTRSTFQPVTTSLATGAVVFAGQPVAILVTGHCDGSDVCLHWGVRRGETYLDPLVWLGGDTPRVRLLSADATPRVTPPFGGTGIMPTPASEKVRDIIMSASYGMLGRWRESYEDMDQNRAMELMRLMQVGELGDRTYGTLSEGERKRVEIARALMTDPELLLLDEPSAGLDLCGREILVGILGRLCANPYAPTVVLVTHHLEEIPSGITHALLLTDGKVYAQGPVREVITSENVSGAYGIPLDVTRTDDRWSARAFHPARRAQQ